MRAAVCRGFGEPLAVEELELAAPGPDEVRVDIAACAVCHSDVTFADGAWGGTLPAVSGHEAAGRVSEVGPGVTAVAPGDPVVVTLIRSCGRCWACRRGDPVLCAATFPLDELLLEELISSRHPLEGINDAFDEVRRGGALRSGVVL